MPRTKTPGARSLPPHTAVIYARYSSDSQREASIEDQLRECRQWAQAHDLRITGEYCDYAVSGRTDERPQFQQMIADADKGLFSTVIMYQTSRFARNRYDAALYKNRLKKAGVTIHYAAMTIPDGPEGIILEALMEGMDEYYSANLSKNIRRGQEGNALKGIAMNQAPIGLRIGKQRMYEIDPVTGPHVLRAFQMIDEGKKQVEVIAYFNDLGMKTSKGKSFTMSSLRTMWSNRKYLGEYRYNDIVLPHIIPQLVPDDLFARVNARIADNRHKPRGEARSMNEFLLTGKLVCGHCGCQMIGDSGTGKSGALYHYYTCSGRKRSHTCRKLSERQTALEKAVVRETVRHVLQPQVLADLIDRAMEIHEHDLQDDPVLRTLQAESKTVDTSLRNILRAIEDGIYTPSTKRRLEELEHQQADLAERIARHQAHRPRITREHMQYFLESFQGGDVEDRDYCRRVIDTLVHSVSISDLPSGGEKNQQRRLTITYYLTKNSSSSLDLTDSDLFGCVAEGSTTTSRHPAGFFY